MCILVWKKGFFATLAAEKSSKIWTHFVFDDANDADDANEDAKICVIFSHTKFLFFYVETVKPRYFVMLLYDGKGVIYPHL